MKQTITPQQELDQILVDLNKEDGKVVVKFLEMYDKPELFYGLLNDRDHLVDVALVNQGKITQKEADKKSEIRMDADPITKIMREKGLL